MSSRNRSADFQPITPNISYKDVDKAIGWLKAAFGFVPHLRYIDPQTGDTTHAQLCFGLSIIMLSHDPASSAVAKPLQSTVVLVSDVDDLFARAIAAGAAIVSEPQDKVFGERQCALADLEGHHWWFTQHLNDVAPEAWGAQLED